MNAAFGVADTVDTRAAVERLAAQHHVSISAWASDLPAAFAAARRTRAPVVVDSLPDGPAGTAAHAYAHIHNIPIVTADTPPTLAAPLVAVCAAYGDLLRAVGTAPARRARTKPYDNPAVVARIVAAREAGASYRSIARDLTAENIPGPNGSGWVHSTVRNVHVRAARPLPSSP